MTRATVRSLSVILILVAARWTMSARATESDAEKGRMKVTTFPPNCITLLPGPLRDAQDRDVRFLLSLDPDRLLHTFRVNAGLPSQAKPLGGWEAPTCELRGHFTGHFLSGCALAYAATSDARLKERVEKVVAGLAQCQSALGASGYLSAFPEEFIDRVETGKEVWAPWYTLHKIGAGLLDAYTLCGDGQALEVLQKMMSWAKQRTDRLDDAQMQNMLKVEHGGMNELLRNLYAVTRNPDHLRLAARFDQRAFLDPLAARRDELKGLHANTNIPKVIGAARAYELTGDSAAYQAAMFFWSQIVRGRSYATGGTSNYEYWRTDPYHLADELSVETHENCCTYNMLRLTEHIFSWTADPFAAEYFERALFNGILPTQKPDDGAGLMYYVPLHAGAFKMFGLPDSSYWCCTGTGIESFAKLSRGIYFRDDSTLFINLFVPSEVRWDERGAVVRQETSFPDQEETTIIIKKGGTFTLAIRIPGWVAPGAASVTVNGTQTGDALRPLNYTTIRRSWKAGDRIVVMIPMRLHLEYLPDDHATAAILYGPVVLAGKLGKEGMTPEMQEGYSWPAVERAVFDCAVATAPRLIIPVADPSAWIRQVQGKPLTFETVNVGKPRDITLIPFFRLFGERYAVYWNLMSEVDWEISGSQRPSLPKGVLDRVQVGDLRSGREHNFQVYRPDTGTTGGYAWVQSPYSIRFDLDVRGRAAATVLCRFVGDGKEYTFELVVDGVMVKTGSLPVLRVGEVHDLLCPIPADLLKGKERVAVRLRAQEGKPTPKLIGCQILSVE